MLKTILDVISAAVVTLGAPLFRTVGNWPGNYPRYLAQADRMGVHWRSTHYYQPTYSNADLPHDVTGERQLPDVDLFPQRQLALLRKFNFQDELTCLKESDSNEAAYSYDNNQYSVGDADSLYSIVRHFKPRRVIEIGSGNSTKIVTKAIAVNRSMYRQYDCQHECIEPYEMPWLEKLGPSIIRKKVQDVPLEKFLELEAGDILFIDSSHVIRPFGDVLYEFQKIIPSLKSGVLIHVHDIFTPRDYPERWLRDDRRLWNEQYLLEVMLQNSTRYRAVLALNWLKHNYRLELERAFPFCGEIDQFEPGAFWFEKL